MAALFNTDFDLLYQCLRNRTSGPYRVTVNSIVEAILTWLLDPSDTSVEQITKDGGNVSLAIRYKAFALLFSTGMIKISREEEKDRVMITKVQNLFRDSFRESLRSMWLLAKVHMAMDTIVEPSANAGAHSRDVMGIWDIIREDNTARDVSVEMMRLLAEEMLKKAELDLADETKEATTLTPALSRRANQDASNTASSSTNRHAPVHAEHSNNDNNNTTTTGQCQPADDQRGASQNAEVLPTHAHPSNPPVRASLLETVSRQFRTLPLTNLWNPINSSAALSNPAPIPQRHRNPLQRHLKPTNKSTANDLYRDKPLPLLPPPTPVSRTSLLVNRSILTASPTSRPPSSVLYQPQSSRPNSALPTLPPSPKGKGKGPRLPPKMPTLPFSSNSSLHKTTSPTATTPPQRKDPELGHPPSPPPSASLPWGPSHPCYPHPNPHVPLNSALYGSTKVIRIPRDWMVVGDLAPTFSNIYPEILDPWVSEFQFRHLVKTVNERLTQTFKPGGIRAWTDAVVGLGTGWLFEDLGFSSVKAGCRKVEASIEDWNIKVSSVGGGADGQSLVRCIPLRRTGYLSLDIQIPDPKVGLVETENPSPSQPATSRPATRPDTTRDRDEARNKEEARSGEGREPGG